MKAAAFDLERPDGIEAAIGLLAGRHDAKILAGGQSLGPMLNLRLARPALLVNLTHLKSLQTISEDRSAWRIGAAVTHARIEDTSLKGCEMLADVARDIAYRSVRTRGTIAGSLVHADPAADWPLCLATLGAELDVQGPSGMRRTGADGFMRAAFTVNLADDEVVVAVVVPKVSARHAWSYFKFCRKQGDFAQASAAILLDPPRRLARVFVGALDGPPRPLPDIAQRLAAGKTPDQAAIEAALEIAIPGLDGIGRRLRSGAVGHAIERLRAIS